MTHDADCLFISLLNLSMSVGEKRTDRYNFLRDDFSASSPKNTCWLSLKGSLFPILYNVSGIYCQLGDYISPTPWKINMEHTPRGLEDHFPF